MAPEDPCELLDIEAVADAGFQLDDEPRRVSENRGEAGAAASLDGLGMDGFRSCDLSYSVSVIVWDAQSPELAASSLDEAVRDAAHGGEARTIPLPADLAMRGAMVIDVDLDNSTVQWQSEDRHIVVNLLAFGDVAGLGQMEVQDLLLELVAYAQERL